MTRALWTYLGRGFLVLVLCGAAAGCGDDDDDAKPDSGVVAGKGGSGGKGGGGGSAGKAGGGGTGGSLSKKQCVDNTTANSTSLHLTAPCIDCACTKSVNVTGTCTAGCWATIACVTTKCAAVLADTTELNKCAVAMCGPELGMPGASGAMGAGMVLSTACMTECAAPVVVPPTGDGGVDDGGTN